MLVSLIQSNFRCRSGSGSVGGLGIHLNNRGSLLHVRNQPRHGGQRAPAPATPSRIHTLLPARLMGDARWRPRGAFLRLHGRYSRRPRRFRTVQLLRTASVYRRAADPQRRRFARRRRPALVPSSPRTGRCGPNANYFSRRSGSTSSGRADTTPSGRSPVPTPGQMGTNRTPSPSSLPAANGFANRSAALKVARTRCPSWTLDQRHVPLDP